MTSSSHAAARRSLASGSDRTMPSSSPSPRPARSLSTWPAGAGGTRTYPAADTGELHAAAGPRGAGLVSAVPTPAPPSGDQVAGGRQDGRPTRGGGAGGQVKERLQAAD